MNSPTPKLPPPSDPMPKGWLRWGVPILIVAALYAFLLAQRGSDPKSTIEYTQFYQLVDDGKVERVVLRGQTVDGSLHSAERVGEREVHDFQTRIPKDDSGLLELLREEKVAVTVADEPDSAWSGLFVSMIPWLLILGVWIWISRRTRNMMAGGNNPFSGVLKSNAKRVESQTIEVTFDDVAGCEGAKRDLLEIVSFLKEPERFQRLGGKLPRGVLLAGAPGTGKTLLARAVAGEAGVPFFSMSGSEFIELFVGVGAARVRELFEGARAEAPAIVFIDEIDAVGRSRGTGLGGGHDEREQTLNQLLAEMDGFDRSHMVVVLAATNRPDVLDPALLRPGRFDRRVVVDLPARDAREAILGVHTRDKPLADDVTLAEIAAATPGFSGADLANLVNEAALTALRRNADTIAAEDFSAAHDKILLGDPRETHLSGAEKERVAVHESGHAIIAHVLPGADDVQRVSVIPRGMALGVTMQRPEERYLVTKTELEAKLQVLMGGYAAEQLVHGEVSSGAESDLKQATDLAHRMVARLGMSDKVGPVYHDHKSEHPFLGARIATDSGVSDATVHAIEQEVARMLGAALEQATATLERHRPAFDRLVAALLDVEVVDRSALLALLDEPPQQTAAPGKSNGNPKLPLAS